MIRYDTRQITLSFGVLISLLLFVFLALPAVSFAENAIAESSSTAKVSKSAVSKLSIEVSGLVCEFCARGLEKSFRKQKKDQVLNISVDMDSSIVSIDLVDGANLSDKDIEKVINDNGLSVVKIIRGGSSK